MRPSGVGVGERWVGGGGSVLVEGGSGLGDSGLVRLFCQSHSLYWLKKMRERGGGSWEEGQRTDDPASHPCKHLGYVYLSNTAEVG